MEVEIGEDWELFEQTDEAVHFLDFWVDGFWFGMDVHALPDGDTTSHVHGIPFQDPLLPDNSKIRID